MLKKEYELLKIFVKKPWDGFSFKQIKDYCKKSSKSYVYSRLKRFVKEDIVKREKIGNVFVYRLNFNVKTFSYLGFIAEYIAFNRKNIPFSEMNEIISRVPYDYFSVLITGSYAKGNENKKSDLDLVIVCEENKEEIYAELKHYCGMNIPFIHLYVFNKNEFIEMLLTDEENYGKETARNNIILYGGEEYFKIISKVINKGFKG